VFADCIGISKTIACGSSRIEVSSVRLANTYLLTHAGPYGLRAVLPETFWRRNDGKQPHYMFPYRTELSKNFRLYLIPFVPHCR
jgi:hypothetical protein